jgi:hypothetical protein
VHRERAGPVEPALVPRALMELQEREAVPRGAVASAATQPAQP